MFGDRLAAQRSAPTPRPADRVQSLQLRPACDGLLDAGGYVCDPMVVCGLLSDAAAYPADKGAAVSRGPWNRDNEPDPALISLCLKLGLPTTGTDSSRLTHVAAFIKQAGWRIRDIDLERAAARERSLQDRREKRRLYELRRNRRLRGEAELGASDWLPELGRVPTEL